MTDVVKLARKRASEVEIARPKAVDDATLEGARAIVNEVRRGGIDALRELGERFGDLGAGAPLTLGKGDLERAFDALPIADRELLARTERRIHAFASAQRAALHNVDFDVPGGRAGHRFAPVERAGCYAPGGRFPLPSSVLMTAVTARAAGVAEVWVASPKPKPITLAAAHVAGADGFLQVGGAHAIAALAHGVGVPRADVIVGPGSKWVTAAKQIVFGAVGIDMLAGPSELVVLADEFADPSMIAADLLAQAEHDDDARPILVATSADLVGAVEGELARQLATLSTRATAEKAISNGYAVVARDLDEAIDVVNRIAPEHLELCVADANLVADRVRHAGAVFIGAGAAEVLGDYGAGPNHVLPTGGTARFSGGLTVLAFLRTRTFLRIDDAVLARQLIDDAEALATLEGLEGHARSAALRRTP